MFFFEVINHKGKRLNINRSYDYFYVKKAIVKVIVTDLFENVNQN